MEFDSGLPVPDLPGYGGESHAEMMERLCNRVRNKWTAQDCFDALSEIALESPYAPKFLELYLASERLAWRNDSQSAIADKALGEFIRERIEDYVLRLAEFQVR